MNPAAMRVIIEENANHCLGVGDVEEGEVIGTFAVTVVLKNQGGTLEEALEASTRLSRVVKEKLSGLSPDVVRVEAEGLALKASTAEERTKKRLKSFKQMLDQMGEEAPAELKEMLAKLAEEDEVLPDLDTFLNEIKTVARMSPWGES